MATLITILATALITFLLDIIGDGIESLFNGILSNPLMNFTDLVTFIPKLFFQDDYTGVAYMKFTNIIMWASIAIMFTVAIISVVKSMVMPAFGKESDSPIQVLFRTAAALIGIILFRPFIEMFVFELLVELAKTDLFSTTIAEGTLGSVWENGARVFSVNIIMHLIVYVSILMGLLTAAITHLERMIGFAFYILLGPICIAFYPSTESRGVASDWLKGFLSQTFGILISLFGITLASKAMTLCVNNFSLFNLFLILAVLGFVKNSEKFVNMLGFKTMANGDTMRGLMSGVGAVAVAGRGLTALGRGGEAGIKGAARYANAVKNGETALQKFTSSARYSSEAAQAAQKATFGTVLNDQKGSVNNKDNFGTKLADTQIANVPMGDPSALDNLQMTKKQFNKAFARNMTDGSKSQKLGASLSPLGLKLNKEREAAYKQYQQRFADAKEGRKYIAEQDAKSSNSASGETSSKNEGNYSITSEQFGAAIGITAQNKQFVPGTEISHGVIDDGGQGGAGVADRNYAYVGKTLSENSNNPGTFNENKEVFMVGSDASINKNIDQFANGKITISDINSSTENASKDVSLGNLSDKITTYGGAASIPLRPKSDSAKLVEALDKNTATMESLNASNRKTNNNK